LTVPRKSGTGFLSTLLGIGLIILAARSYGAEVALAWDANRESDLEGYGVYFKAGADGPPYDFFGYVDVSDLADAESPAFTVTGLQPNATYHFAITAYDVSGNESAFSAPVCAEVGAVVAPCVSAGGSTGTTPPATGSPSSSPVVAASAASGGGGGGGCFIRTLALF
jgi:hypothetical protein